ncbi:hypothetical protein PENTCL1PPCAC_23717, partial [Pristionchus entomophagus]
MSALKVKDAILQFETDVAPSAPEASPNVTLTICDTSSETDEKKGCTWKRKGIVVGVVLGLILIIAIAAVIWSTTKGHKVTISTLPTGFADIVGTESSRGMAGGNAVYMRFSVKVTAQFYHPGSQIDVDSFKATVYNSGQRIGGTGMMLVKSKSVSTFEFIQKGSLTFITFSVQLAMHRGDNGFDQCVSEEGYS